MWGCFARWWDVGVFYFISFLVPKPGPISRYPGNAIQTSNTEVLHSCVGVRSGYPHFAY